MKNKSGFTLIELLIVIAIIGILAALLLPAISSVMNSAKKAKAKLEEQDIVTAISHYESIYGRFPVAENTNIDLTYGGQLYDSRSATLHQFGVASNNTVVAILVNNTNWANGINAGYVRNPQQTKFLNAKMTDDTVSPGIGTDGVYRDPWGNPYIISIDSSYDDMCKDELYSLDKVSGHNQTSANPGLNGLINPDTTAVDNFQYRGKVMVWSAGPNGKVDSGDPANDHENKDNVLSWK